MLNTLRNAVLATVILLAALPALADPAPWWNADWACRREVTVKSVPDTGLPGEEVGVATFFTGGLMAADGQDIRVTTRANEPVAHRVLMVGPGDQVRVAFALRKGTTAYYVYFGNAKAPMPDKELDIQRGVLMESYEYPAGPVARLEQVRRLFQQAKPLIGRDFRENIFIGHNPFGPQNQICTRYTIHLVAPEEGEYTFAISSSDASFLLENGEILIANPGRHPPQRDISQRKTTRLSKGLHKLEMLHVNVGGDPIAVLAWKAPADGRVWTIPPAAFAPVAQASLGVFEQRGQALAADFGITHAGEAFVENRYYQRYIFRDFTSLGKPADLKLAWDFGDGQTSTKATVEHVYLAPGLYTVKLTAISGTATLTRINKVLVSREWDKVTVNALDGPKVHGQIVAGYDFSKLPQADYLPAGELFSRCQMGAPLTALAEAMLARGSAGPESLQRVLTLACQEWRQGKQPGRAVSALLKGAAMSRSPAVGAELAVLAGQITLEDLNQPDEAMKLFESATRKYAELTASPALRAARIGIGQVWRIRGDYDKAREVFSKVPRASGDAGYVKEAVRRGDLARHVEEYLRTSQLEDAATALDNWEDEFPLDRLEGYSTQMRVELLRKQKRWSEVVSQADALVKVNPKSNYAPRLLLELADACDQLKQSDKAKAARERVVKEYPESSLVAEADRKLGRGE